jgi:hypothetical protein
VTAAPTETPPPEILKERIEVVLQMIRRRDLLTTNGFWTIFHGILGLGPSVNLLNPETGARVNALDYICKGGEVRGMRFIPTKYGLDVQTGPMFVGQGHQDQFIAEMAQWGMPADRKFLVLGKEYTYMDFVRNAQAQARLNDNQELSWTLPTVADYVGTDASWTNAHGEKLRFEDLVRYELNQPVETAACGGTHRLFGLSWAYHIYLRKGGKKEGVWQGVADKTLVYKNRAHQWQNPDGSFSTNFFRERGNDADIQLRINSSGHTLEWLALALPDNELKERWVQDAVHALTMMLLDAQSSPVESGTLYHAMHGLLIYYARVFDPEKLGEHRPLIPLPPDWRVAAAP